MFSTQSRNLFFSLFAGSILVSCATKESVRAILLDNPEIVFEAIEKDPAKFAAVTQKMAGEMQKARQARAEEELRAQQEADFKNPKKPELDADRAVRGNKNAPVTIVAYSDFQCPYCSRGNATIEEVRQKYGDKVNFVFKHLPLEGHKYAMPAALRFEALTLQSPDVAFKFHDEVFKNQSNLMSQGEEYLDNVAKRVGGNVEKMKKDMKSDKVKSRVAADTQEARNFGIRGTPGFIVGGVAVRGALPATAFESIIDRQLATKSN